MTKGPLIMTTSKFTTSYELASQALTQADPEKVARLAGGDYDPVKRAITIEMCARPISYLLDRQVLVWADTGEDFLETPADIPILHYLQNAGGAQPTGELLPYRELWGANAQSGPFIARHEARLAEKYGSDPGAVLAAAGRIKARVTEQSGDARIEIDFFPNVTMAAALYAPDEELPAEAKILYDAVIKEYLPTEDAIGVAEILTKRLTS